MDWSDLSILLLIFSLLLAIFSYLATDEKSKRRKTWRFLALLCAAGNLIVSFTIKQRDDASKLEREQERVEYEKKLNTKTDEISRKSDKIAELSQELTASVTGGDSYGYWSFLLGDGTTNNPMGIFTHVGKYPLYDVIVYVTDYEKFKSLVPKGGLWIGSADSFRTLEYVDKNRMQIEVGNVAVGKATRFSGWGNLPDREIVTYSIKIDSRFWSWYQHLKLRRVNGKWKLAFRVFKEEPNKTITVLLEFVPKDFPRDDQGESFWKYK